MSRIVLGFGGVLGTLQYHRFCYFSSGNEGFLMDKNRAQTIDFGVPKTRKIAKSMVLERPQYPQTPKLCGKRSIIIIFLTKKNKIKIAKIIFSQYFRDFFTRQNPKIRDFADPGMCPYLPSARDPSDVGCVTKFQEFDHFWACAAWAGSRRLGPLNISL